MITASACKMTKKGPIYCLGFCYLSNAMAKKFDLIKKLWGIDSEVS